MASLPSVLVENPTCPNEWQTITLDQSCVGTVQLTLRDDNGDVYPLTNANQVVTFNCMEYEKAPTVQFTKTCTIVDAAGGIVSFTVTATDLVYPGLWLGEFALASNLPSAVYARVRCFVEIKTDIVTTSDTWKPITIAEIRLAMRDRCAADNFLLDNVEFSTSEIAWAIRRPIDYWNEAKPPIPETYTAVTFPYRYHWMDATIGELLRLAAFNLTRNRMPVQSGGISADDKIRSEMYLKLGDKYITEYKQWVASEKYSLNLQAGYSYTHIRAFGGRSY